MPDTNLDSWHMVRGRTDKAQESRDLVRIRKEISMSMNNNRFKWKLLKDSNPTQYIYHLID